MRNTLRRIFLLLFCVIAALSYLKSDCLSDLYYLKDCLPKNAIRAMDAEQERFIEQGRHETSNMLAQLPRYKGIMQEALRQENLPSWLMYISLAESRLKVDAVSPAGAAGLWQIMPRTARYLGLTVNSHLDERLDAVKSSRAAAQYMKQLHAQFDDWLLAIAAYNCGPGNVRKAQRKAGAYFYHEISHYLPRQTQVYIPRVLTIAEISEAPKLYGLTVKPLIDAPLLVELTATTDFDVLSRYYNISREQLQQLNPSFKNQKINVSVEEVVQVFLPSVGLRVSELEIVPAVFLPLAIHSRVDSYGANQWWQDIYRQGRLFAKSSSQNIV